MTNNKKVSIIVPVYNVEKYIKECINAIRIQSYTNFECIVIDDGSTDQSVRICEALIKDDNRFVVLHQKNSGLASARNRGLDYATGDYIFFVDSDDYIGSHVIECCVHEINNGDVGIVQIPHKWIKEDEVPQHSSSNEIYNVELIDSEQAIKETYSKIIEDSFSFSVVWNKLYKASIFSNGLRFANGKMFEDTLIVHHLYLAAKKIKVLSCADYYYYRIRNGSICHSSFRPKSLDILDGFQDRLDTICKENFICLKTIALSKYLNSIMSNWCVVYDAENGTHELLFMLVNRARDALVYYRDIRLTLVEMILFRLFLINPKSIYFLKLLKKNTMEVFGK